MASPRRLPTGKVPSDVLRRIVFPHCGVESDRVIQGPRVGEDAAVIDMGDRVIIAKANPITGAEGRIGWIAVHVNANDVASCGARPQWFMPIILLPEGADEPLLKCIMADIHEACCDLGITVIGGHTETSPGLDRPIIAGFMLGELPKGRYVTTGGARVGDLVIMTKGAGIEGTGILSTDLAEKLRSKVPPETLEAAAKLLSRISVVRDALKAMEVGGVHSLHTPTEGGVLNGIWEMTEAADAGVVIRESEIPVAEETRLICAALDVDPLKLLASGALLIVSEPGKAVEIVSALSEVGVEASVIGEVRSREEGRFLVSGDGERIPIEAIGQDELYRVIDEQG
jgi:hydrogenase expression/formation protein HypE